MRTNIRPVSYTFRAFCLFYFIGSDIESYDCYYSVGTDTMIFCKSDPRDDRNRLGRSNKAFRAAGPRCPISVGLFHCQKTFLVPCSRDQISK